MADGSSLSYITVDVKDANNNIVAGANNKINSQLKEKERLLGLIMEILVTQNSYKGNSRKSL